MTDNRLKENHPNAAYLWRLFIKAKKFDAVEMKRGLQKEAEQNKEE